MRVNNPQQRKVKDVELAVKSLVEQLQENDAKVALTKAETKDQFIYHLSLTEPKTSKLRPRSAVNKYGAPYSHIPKDRVLS